MIHYLSILLLVLIIGNGAYRIILLNVMWPSVLALVIAVMHTHRMPCIKGIRKHTPII